MKSHRNIKTVEDIMRQYGSGYRDFARTTVEAGDFSKRRLHAISFDGATLMGCNFAQSQLSRANLNAANLRNTNFKGANLSKAVLTGTDFRGANLRQANLSGADLRYANLEGVNLSGADISGANFDGTNLHNANLKDCNPGKLWWKANLDEARLDGATLPNGIVYGTSPEDVP
jgi:uncharacterized protein YjbI with pentapeptide repeats